MNKILIKVIKRKDVELTAAAKIQSASAAKRAAPESEEKTELRLRRRMVGTVSGWISERRENNRIEKISAIRGMFGGEPLLNKI